MLLDPGLGLGCCQFKTHTFGKTHDYLSFTCHLKWVFGPQSEWSRRKFPSLAKSRKRARQRSALKVWLVPGVTTSSGRRA